MPVARLNGVDLYYEEHGAGFPIVLTHGFCLTSRMWAPQVRALSDRYRVITWDMRGHGRTESPEAQESYSEAHVVEDMVALLRHLGVSRAVAGGQDLGGPMTLAFRLAHPEMVQALIMVDARPGWADVEERERWNEASFARAARLDEEGLGAIAENPYYAPFIGDHRSASGLAKAGRGMLAKFHSRLVDTLEEIAVPTLILVGENDAPFLGPAEEMARRIPNAEKIMIADAGHAANLDQPEIVNAAIGAFLDSVFQGSIAERR
jgi:pimeloyl-ACP methyl ester carboxylesterase